MAQAQECILEKSILDHRKPAIIAKVCAQVYMYYDTAWSKIVNYSAASIADMREDTIIAILGWDLAKEWTAYPEFKYLYYTALTNFYLGVEAEEGSDWGQAVAYFEQASKDLVEAGKASKHFSSSYREANNIDNCLAFTTDVIDGKLEGVKKENEYIYHEKVPDFETLPKHKGAPLVKGIGFDINDSEISGEFYAYFMGEN